LHVQSASSSLDSGALLLDGHPWHTFDAAPATVEYWPAEQLLHAASPSAILYLPAAHIVQAVLSGPVYPATHWHVELVLSLTVFCPHKTHIVPVGDEMSA